MTRDLLGKSGFASDQASGYSVGYSFGEDVAGETPANGSMSHMSGYYAGWIGNGLPFQLNHSQVPAVGPVIQNVQVGVALQTTLELDFSDQIMDVTISSAITLTLLQDHLGTVQNTVIPLQIAYNQAGNTVTISPNGSWLGNTLYQLSISSGLCDLDGNPLLNPTTLVFLTVLDPQQSNVVWEPFDQPLQSQGMISRTLSAGSQPMMIQIPAGALPNYSYILVNPNPIGAPIYVSPQAILDANQTAQRSGGAYETPLSLQEVTATDLNKESITTLSTPVRISLPYQNSGNPGFVRSSTLSFWALDSAHHLWVKIPDTQNNLSANSASVSVSQFGVFALMGEASGDASDVFVFPTPWRPHGPNAGSGPGQTGTDDGGMTFSNLPSECTIRIYTISGELVRQLPHSDTTGSLGQEKWDGLTAHGEHASSGVYLWRVESASNAKNGKLMIIR